MLRAFETNIARKGLFEKNHRLLLAISGGVDSVVLAHLLHKSRFKFDLAHFNFKLRGKDSDADEAFCRKLAQTLHVGIHVTSKDLTALRKETGWSVQMAARQARYEWFRQLQQKERYDYVLTAHHADDAAETFFINLARGTGINGLKGISERREDIRRPLLIFSKKEIDAFAKAQKLKFRTDKSNLEDKYRRNSIRLHILPHFRKLYPQFDLTMLSNMARLREESEALKAFFAEKQKKLFVQKKGGLRAELKMLSAEGSLSSFLHHVLSGYGFNETQCKNIETAVQRRASGKVFLSANYTAVTDKSHLWILKNSTSFTPRTIASLNELSHSEFFTVEQLKKFRRPSVNQLIVEPGMLKFPLTVRAVKPGDRFRPFGMKGFKLLSDFLKDAGVNRGERKQVKLLLDAGDNIVWVIGHRSDDRFKAKETGKDFLMITWHG